MKKALIFAGGVVTGFVLTLVISLMMAKCQSEGDDGFTMFSKPGAVIDIPSFEVMQVTDIGALANGESGTDMYYGLLVLFPAEDGKSYYDDQIIKVPKGKCVRQIGTFQYQNRMGTVKTVPVVDFFDR